MTLYAFTLTIFLFILPVCIQGHNDYLTLEQPEIIESPCVKQWNEMQSNFQFQHDRLNELRRPLMFEIEGTELLVNLTVQIDRFESRYVAFNTRTYNGRIPAPTIKVCPGDKLIIHMKNELGEGVANSTNVHLHGLHVSPKGMSDNVLVNVESGGERTYEYKIRPDHPSGTFWYHPHTHGIVNTQLSGLMAGALIVVDRPGDFPSEIANMREEILILQGICVEKCHTTYDCIVNALMNDYAQCSSGNDQDAIEQMESANEGFLVDLRVDKNSPLNDTSLLHVYVNGQYMPEVHMERNVFMRFRILNAISNNVAELVVPTECQMYLLGMDGIYRNNKPTMKPVIILPPGGRADIAMRCSETGEFILATESSSKRNKLLGKINHHRVPSQDIMLLRVLENENLASKDQVPNTVSKLTDFDIEEVILPKKPWYMEDNLKRNSTKEVHHYDYEFSIWKDPAKQGKITFGVNGVPFSHDYINHSMQVGSLQRWELSVNNYGRICDPEQNEELLKLDDRVINDCHTMNHPFHMHGSHFQITRRDDSELDPDNLLFEIGEWRDTIPLFRSNVEIHFTPRRHMVGRILTHCHISSHSDTGMGQLIEVTSDS